MSKTTVDGTATAAAMTDGREIIGKTGTTNTAQSAFFIGAIPQEALAVGMFTNNQSGTGNQTLNGLGGQSQGGFGGTWPATIWHTYAQNKFLPLPVVQFTTPVFTGQTWNLVPPNLRNVGKKHPKKNDNNNPNPGNGGNPVRPAREREPEPVPHLQLRPVRGDLQPERLGRRRQHPVGERHRGGRRDGRHLCRAARDVPVGPAPLAPGSL